MRRSLSSTTEHAKGYHQMMTARSTAVLRHAVAARDLTHRELARLLDCSHGHIGFVLAGRSVEREFAKRMARVLRRPLDSLFVVEPSTAEHADERPAVSA